MEEYRHNRYFYRNGYNIPFKPVELNKFLNYSVSGGYILTDKRTSDSEKFRTDTSYDSQYADGRGVRSIIISKKKEEIPNIDTLVFYEYSYSNIHYGDFLMEYVDIKVKKEKDGDFEFLKRVEPVQSADRKMIIVDLGYDFRQHILSNYQVQFTIYSSDARYTGSYGYTFFETNNSSYLFKDGGMYKTLGYKEKPKYALNKQEIFPIEEKEFLGEDGDSLSFFVSIIGRESAKISLNKDIEINISGNGLKAMGGNAVSDNREFSGNTYYYQITFIRVGIYIYARVSSFLDGSFYESTVYAKNSNDMIVKSNEITISGYIHDCRIVEEEFQSNELLKYIRKCNEDNENEVYSKYNNNEFFSYKVKSSGKYANGEHLEELGDSYRKSLEFLEVQDLGERYPKEKDFIDKGFNLLSLNRIDVRKDYKLSSTSYKSSNEKRYKKSINLDEVGLFEIRNDRKKRVEKSIEKKEDVLLWLDY